MLGELIHVWNRCNGCGAEPIIGRRFECQTCPAGPDIDLCESCYQLFLKGKLRHPASQRLTPGTRMASHLFVAVEGRPHGDSLRWLAVPQADVLAPTIPDRFVVRPEFRCGPESYVGSCAFVVQWKNERIILTALHVLDELIKCRGLDCTRNNKSYTGNELPGILTDVILYDVLADHWVFAQVGTAGPMLTLPDARVGEKEPCSQRDIAAFRAAHFASSSPAKLAEGSPCIGEPIWLANIGARRGECRTLQAVVVDSTEETLVFRFASSEAVLRNSSGAPLLNRRGEVVGINVGAGMYRHQRFGHGHHVSSIRRHLDSESGAQRD